MSACTYIKYLEIKYRRGRERRSIVRIDCNRSHFKCFSPGRVCFLEKKGKKMRDVLPFFLMLNWSSTARTSAWLRRIKREMDFFVYYWIANDVVPVGRGKPRHGPKSQDTYTVWYQNSRTKVVRTGKTTWLSWNRNVENEVANNTGLCGK